MMTEEEARQALFQINYEYMQHPPKERLELYNEYQEKRAKIRKELINAMIQKRMEEMEGK